MVLSKIFSVYKLMYLALRQSATGVLCHVCLLLKEQQNMVDFVHDYTVPEQRALSVRVLLFCVG